MRDWIRLAARLYPAQWRARYGREFEALLEDATPTAGDLWDTVRWALEMQMRIGNMPKIALAAGLAGALLAGAVHWKSSPEYTARGVIRVTAAPDDFEEQWRDAESDVLSRGHLAQRIMERNLYRGERQRLPLEDVVTDMRQHVLIQPVYSGGKLQSYEVAITYRDPLAAEGVTREIMQGLARTAAQSGEQVEVSAPPDFPRNGTHPFRTNAAICGMITGLALGCGTVWMWRLPRRWKLGLLAGAAAGAVAAAGALLALSYTGTLHYVTPDYVSSATFRTDANTGAVERKLADRDILWPAIVDLGLYRRERQRRPMRQVLEGAHRHLHLERASPRTFTVSFAYEDPARAQAALQVIIARINRDLSVDRQLTPGALARFAADYREARVRPSPDAVFAFPAYLNNPALSDAKLGVGGMTYQHDPIDLVTEELLTQFRSLTWIAPRANGLILIDPPSLPVVNRLALGPEHGLAAGALAGMLAAALLRWRLVRAA